MAIAHIADPIANIMLDTIITFFRPKWSEAGPAISDPNAANPLKFFR